MIRVKLSGRGGSPASDLSQFLPDSGTSWDNCTFLVNDGALEADVWFVSEDVDDLDRTCLVPRERVVFISAETSWPPNRYSTGTVLDGFLDQFAQVLSCHDIYRPNVKFMPPFLPWMINGNHGDSLLAPHERDFVFLNQLRSLPKTRDLSVFCSAQEMTANHRMRIRFVQALKEHFGDRLDWFGNGLNPLPSKWPGIAPYRYTLVLENQSTNSVFTEKIMDAYLGLAFPIYWGAPDLDRFFPERSFAPINIRDLWGSIDLIEDLLVSCVAEDRSSEILEAKRRVLWEHNVFRRLAKIAEELVRASPNADAEHVKLWSWSFEDSRRTRKGPVARYGRKLASTGRRLLEPR